MSTHDDFLEEKNKIDSLIERGYVIKKAIEDLDGSHVEFEKKGEKGDKETLHLMNPNSRKYFSSLIFKQHQQGSEIGTL